MNGAPAFAAVTVITAAALDATTSLFSGKPENGSGAVVVLISAAMPAAMVAGVSVGRDDVADRDAVDVVDSVSPWVTLPPTVRSCCEREEARRPCRSRWPAAETAVASVKPALIVITIGRRKSRGTWRSAAGRRRGPGRPPR